MRRAIGIDLGTTTTTVAVMDGDRPTLLAPAGPYGTSLPSTVAFGRDGRALVGEPAIAAARAGTATAVRSAVRHLGRAWDPGVAGAPHDAVDLVALILADARRWAETALDETVDDAVISVPTAFDLGQRQAMREAAAQAGWGQAWIASGTSLAAVGNAVMQPEQQGRIAVVDLGGGHLSVGVVEVEDSVVEVQGQFGTAAVGGDEWDERIASWLKSHLGQRGIDLPHEWRSRWTTLDAAATAKAELSRRTVARLDTTTILGSDRPEAPVELDRRGLAQLSADLLRQVSVGIGRALGAADISAVDHVLLLGEAARLPGLGPVIAEATGAQVPEWPTAFPMAAAGAALRHATLLGVSGGPLLLDAQAHELAIPTTEGTAHQVVAADSTFPYRVVRTFETTVDQLPSLHLWFVEGDGPTDQRSVVAHLLLDGCGQLPAGSRVTVEAELDAVGIATFSVVHDASGIRGRPLPVDDPRPSWAPASPVRPA